MLGAALFYAGERGLVRRGLSRQWLTRTGITISILPVATFTTILLIVVHASRKVQPVKLSLDADRITAMLFGVQLGVPAGKNGTPKTSTKPPAHPTPRSDICVTRTWFIWAGVLLGARRSNCRAVRSGGGNRQEVLSQC